VHALSWSHNAYYHPLLLSHLPDRCDRVLDVGCGRGDFAVQLSARAAHVDALDRSPIMVAEARGTVPDNVTCLQADVLDPGLDLGPYDAITSISTLHHLPLPTVLPRLASWLRPGGVLAAIAVLRADVPRELPVEAAAVAFTNARGLVLAGRRALRGEPRPTVNSQMPVKDPELTLRQVQRQVDTELPGAQTRRLLLWRYLLIWHKP
jgi:trans-aconitate methyltransferase